MGFFKWIKKVFGLITKLQKAIDSFFNTEYGVFLKSVIAKIYEEIQSVIKENVPKENRKEEVFKRTVDFCKSQEITQSDSWINFSIELIYNLHKVGLLGFLL